MKSFLTAATVMAVLAFASAAMAQGYVTFLPVGPAPVTAYYAPAPVVVARPVVATSYYAPAATYYAPAPAPYYAASPVVTPYYVASPVAVPAPLYYGRPVVVHPKIYVPGQPVRNVLRAVTP